MTYSEVMKQMKMTPLMIAIKEGESIGVLHLLESTGYDPNERDIYGFNAEDWAELYDRKWHLSILRVYKKGN